MRKPFTKLFNQINNTITHLHSIIKSSPNESEERESGRRESGRRERGPIPFLGFSAHCPLIPLSPTPEIRLPPPLTAHAPGSKEGEAGPTSERRDAAPSAVRTGLEGKPRATVFRQSCGAAKHGGGLSAAVSTFRRRN